MRFYRYQAITLSTSHCPQSTTMVFFELCRCTRGAHDYGAQLEQREQSHTRERDTKTGKINTTRLKGPHLAKN